MEILTFVWGLNFAWIFIIFLIWLVFVIICTKVAIDLCKDESIILGLLGILLFFVAWSVIGLLIGIHIYAINNHKREKKD